MDIYKEAGKTGRVYYVFDTSVKIDEAIREVARIKKVSKDRLRPLWAYVKNDELYLEDVEYSSTVIAVPGR